MLSDKEHDYDVGYGKPATAHPFIKGQSGNPRGRPPGAKNLKTRERWMWATNQDRGR